MSLGLVAVNFVVFERLAIAQCRMRPEFLKRSAHHGFRTLKKTMSEFWHILCVFR